MKGTPGTNDVNVTQETESVAVVEVNCELDMLTAPPLEHALSRGVAAGNRLLVVDLSGCDFMGSSGLAALARAHEQARESGVEFALVGLNRTLLRALEITGLDGVFAICPSRQEAIAMASAPRTAVESAAPSLLS